MCSAASSVCLSADLLPRVTAFQNGVHHDVVPLIRALHRTAADDENDALTGFRKVLGDWLKVHCADRLPDVITMVPAMLPMVTDYAATVGDIELLEMIWNKCPRSENSNDEGAALVYVAALAGQVDMVAFLLSQIDATDACGRAISHAMVGAASKGHLRVVEYLHRHRHDRQTTDLMDVAASQGHLSVVEFLHLHRREGCTTAAMDRAAGNGHLDVVKFLHAHRREGCTKAAISLAAAGGHLHVVQWLCDHRKEGWHGDALTHAAAGGHVDILAFLLQKRPRAGCLVLGMDLAATNGHLDVVKFLHTHRKDGCSDKALAGALRNGHTHVVAYFLKHGDDLIHGVCCACGFNKPRRHACLVKSM
ncbi:hypothetical protein H310_09607 [Aphanomyces invadans]|nr:hypothetical protein H310_09607 [Aphanomyces invadans]ETV97226.1 hypothetical protein H310_09607 [Aphanomyces invadans]|eukprot:XP_008873934.1 hypothetical protein H310_09607 [Aphanomyces invadans]